MSENKGSSSDGAPEDIVYLGKCDECKTWNNDCFWRDGGVPPCESCAMSKDTGECHPSFHTSHNYKSRPSWTREKAINYQKEHLPKVERWLSTGNVAPSAGHRLREICGNCFRRQNMKADARAQCASAMQLRKPCQHCLDNTLNCMLPQMDKSDDMSFEEIRYWSVVYGYDSYVWMPHESNRVRNKWLCDYCTKRPDFDREKHGCTSGMPCTICVRYTREGCDTPGRTKAHGEHKVLNNTIYARKDYDKEQVQAKQKQVPPSSSEMSKRGRSSDSPPGSTATEVKKSRPIGSEDVGTGFEQMQPGQRSTAEGTGEGQALGGQGEDMDGEADASGETDSDLDADGESVYD